MKVFAISLINFYQRFVSPMFAPSCIYSPSCSEYAKQSFIKYGFFKGLVMSTYRVLRCGPWSSGGVDEVV
ncbi:MAG: membrane protein insertion efficiency factor YidD [Gammaproteobacteria bacterium]